MKRKLILTGWLVFMPTNLILVKRGEIMKKALLKTNCYDVEDTLIIVGNVDKFNISKKR